MGSFIECEDVIVSSRVCMRHRLARGAAVASYSDCTVHPTRKQLFRNYASGGAACSCSRHSDAVLFCDKQTVRAKMHSEEFTL
jgi:hypothetical protein